MWTIVKTLEIAASHHLELDYESKCGRPHGHNWIIRVFCRSDSLDSNGMLLDFGMVKKLVHDELDHRNLNSVLLCNPTAENIARWVVDTVPFCFKAEVQESSGNIAIYEASDA